MHKSVPAIWPITISHILKTYLKSGYFHDQKKKKKKKSPHCRWAAECHTSRGTGKGVTHTARKRSIKITLNTARIPVRETGCGRPTEQEGLIRASQPTAKCPGIQSQVRLEQDTALPNKSEKWDLRTHRSAKHLLPMARLLDEQHTWRQDTNIYKNNKCCPKLHGSYGPLRGHVTFHETTKLLST